MGKLQIHRCCECGKQAVWNNANNQMLGKYYCNDCLPTFLASKTHPSTNYIFNKDGFKWKQTRYMLTYDDILTTYHLTMENLSVNEAQVVGDELYSILDKIAPYYTDVDYNLFLGTFGNFMWDYLEESFYNKRLRNFYFEFKNILSLKKF